MRADRVRGGPVQDGDGLPQVDEAKRGRQAAAAGGIEEEYGRVPSVYVLLETLTLTITTNRIKLILATPAVL